MGSVGLELDNDELFCSEGFLCNENFSKESNIRVKVPDQGDVICPSGQACPTGNNIRDNKCTVNSFQSAAGQPDCKKCPAGQNCREDADVPESNFPGIIFPKPCPVNKFCQEGANAETCEKGSYNTDISHLTSNEECASCPPGHHCTDGQIQGNCEAGFICYGGSGTRQWYHTSIYN